MAKTATVDGDAAPLQILVGFIRAIETMDAPTRAATVTQFLHRNAPHSYFVDIGLVGAMGEVDIAMEHLLDAIREGRPLEFTPDNDGLNDVFLPEIRGISQDGYLFRVFDRWGHIVFETEQTGEPWIGDFERGDYYAQNDVYVWMIEAVELSTGDRKRFYGHVTMAR